MQFTEDGGQSTRLRSPSYAAAHRRQKSSGYLLFVIDYWLALFDFWV